MTRKDKAQGRRRSIRLRNLAKAAIRHGGTPTRAQMMATAMPGIPVFDVRATGMAPGDVRGLEMAA